MRRLVLRSRPLLSVLVIVAVIATTFVVTRTLFQVPENARTIERIERVVKRIEEVSKADQDRTKGSLVAVCALGELQRINENNQLADLARLRPFTTTPAFNEYLKLQQAANQPVDCKAFVPAEDRVKLCLQYPPRNDPLTGLPIPTTTTPQEAKACSQ